MESRVDDLKLAGAPSAVVGEAGTLVEHQLVMALPFSESFCETPAQVVEQVAPVVGQGTDKRRKRRRQTKSLAPKHHPAPKTMKEEEEEVCFICFDGGSLVLCDRKGCPKAYHPACIKREEAFFQSKAKWDCGWHICSICEKAAHYMCYTCTYALCKRCSKNADYVCVRENKGFCTMCMKTIMMIENIDAGNKELIQVDFDDKTSWEYLFKMYWNLLKGKLSLSVDELIQAKNPLVGVIGTDLKQQTPGKDKSTGGVAVRISPKSSEHSKQNPRRGVIGTNIKQQIPEKDNFTEGVAVPNLLKSSEHSEQNTLQDQHQLPDQSSFSAEKLRADKRKISDVCSDWGSKELLEFVAHMKNGDTSVLSQADVQSLLMAYIKKNNLLNPRMKSQIICDLRLKLLFGKPRVGHIEMLKLLECHYLLKEDTPKNAFIDGCTSHVGDDQNDDSVSNPSKRQKTRKKGEERAPQVNLNEYAAIDAHNINLIFLRRTAIENLIDEVEKFHEKVVGSVVRIRVSCNDQGQDFYRLVRVVGTSKGAEPYKLGYKTTDFMIEVLNLDKKETLSIDAVSNQVFTEDECKDLHQNVKCGIVKPLTVGDIQMKAVALQPLRFDDWLIAEILRLSHLRDKADENGHKKEHRECVEKLKLLRTPEVRHQKLTEIPEVHIDPKMNPNHQSEDDTSKDDKQKGGVSKLGITGDHTLQPRKCVKENEATSAQAVQQKRDDGDGSNSSPNHRLRPRKSVKENKTSSAQRVQPKRGRGGSNGFPKQENHVSPGGSSSVVGNQSVLRPDSETATVAPVSTIRAQKRDGGGSSSFPKQENDVSPGGSSSLVGNQSVPRPDSETAVVAPVSSIQVQQKRDGGGSNSFLKQENHVSPGGDGSTSVIGNQSVLRPDSGTATVAPVSTIRVQPKRHGVTSNSISKQENRVSPGGSSSVLGNQSVRRSDSETATVAPVSTIRVQPKRDGGRSNSIPKQENHVSPGVFSSVPGNQSVPRPDPETVSVAPVSTIRVQQKRGSGRSKSFPKQENQVSAGCSSSVAGNQSVLRPDQVTAKVAPVSRIRVQQKKGGGGSPKHENHVSPRGSSSVVSNQSVQMPDLETATVAPVSRIQVQQKRDRGDSNSSPKQENHVSLSDSSIVIGNQSELKPDSETATVSPVSGIQAQQKGAGGGSNSSPQQDNHVSLGGGSSSVIGNQSGQKPDSETAAVAPVSGIQVQEKRDGGSDSSPQQHNHVSPGGGSSSVIGNQSVLRPDSEAATVAPVSGTSLPTNDTQMEKLWHYRDPNGKIQGPFSIVQLQKWSTTGYFPLDMRIWTDNEQDHSVLLTDALAGDLCSDTRSNAAGEGLDSDTSDCSAHALAKEKQPEVVQCCDLLKTVSAYSERPVVRNNNLETYAEPLNQVTKPGVEELNDAGVNEHPDEAPLHDSSGMVSEVAGVNEHPNEALMHHSPSIESKNAGVNVHPVEAPLQYAPSIESKDAGINDHPDETLLHCSPDIESKDAGVNEHPNEAQLHRSPDIERKDAGVNKHPTEAPMHHSPSIESENACVNEHPNEASLLHSPGIESKEMSSMNQNYVSSGQIRPPVLLDLDLNNKDCNPASSLSNPNESPESKVDSDLVILPSPTPKTGDRNSESQLNEEDSMSVDIQAAELLRSLSGYVPVNGMTVSDVQTPANNEMDEDLPIPTPKPSDSDDGDLRNPEQKPSDENQFGQSDENRLEESDDGPCKILMKDLGWSNASSQVVGGVATAGVWISSPARDEPSCKEWDFGLVPMSSLQHSDAVGGDQVATTTPNGSRHLLLDLSSWPAGINEPIEFNTLAEESVSDLLAEVDAMESKSGLPSPSSAMRCGDDLIDRNDCFSSIEELSPTPDAGKSDAVSSNPGIRFPSQATEFHDHDPVGASQASAFDPLKRSTAHSTTSSGAETKSVGYPINFWEPGPDIHPPAPGTLNQQPMVNAPPPNHVWGAVQGNVNMGWAGPPPLAPPPQAFANMGWRPSIGTTAPWVDSNLSLGAYNGNGGWDNNPHRFSGSRDYAVQSGDMGFGRGGRPTWNRQQHGGGGGGGGGGHSRPSPKGQRVCKFYESGHCKKGSACGYLHP